MATKRKKKTLTPEDVLAMRFNKFNSGLNKLTEQQLEEALQLELARNGTRPSYLERIRQRHASKREAREKLELKERMEAT